MSGDQNSTSNVNVKLTSADVEILLILSCATKIQRQILTLTRFSFSTKMQRLSDIMSNVNLTLHRRLVPAGFIQSSLTMGMVPSSLKTAAVTSLLKKPGSDPNNTQNCCCSTCSTMSGKDTFKSNALQYCVTP